MLQTQYEHCEHLTNSLRRDMADATIQKFVYLLSDGGLVFDAFAFSGYSGALIAPTLAYLMKKELILVRKNKGQDFSMSSRWAEGNRLASRVVIVDDLISSGRTMRNSINGLKEFAPTAEIVGLLLYNHCGIPNESEIDLFLPGSRMFERMKNLIEWWADRP